MAILSAYQVAREGYRTYVATLREIPGYPEPPPWEQLPQELKDAHAAGARRVLEVAQVVIRTPDGEPPPQPGTARGEQRWG